MCTCFFIFSQVHADQVIWSAGLDNFVLKTASCVVISFDPFVNKLFDILDNKQFSMIRKLCYSGRTDSLHGGPVCATWSKLRYCGAGPPPLRSRKRPYGLPVLSAKNMFSLLKGTEFFLRHLDCCEGVARTGGDTHHRASD